MSLNLQFTVTLSSLIEGVDSESVGPYSLDDDAIVGDSLRRTVALQTGIWTTLEIGEITPHGWVVVNLDDTDDIKIGWGTGEPILLPPGKPGIWWGTEIPRAQDATGTPKLLYLVFAKT